MSKLELINMGLNVQNFIVPGSNWTEDMGALAMQYYNSVAAGYHNGYFNNIPPDDVYWLARKGVGRTTTIDEVRNWINEAIIEDKWLILMFHHIGEPESSPYPDLYWPEENLEALVEWVNTQDILIVTQQQGLDSYNLNLREYLSDFKFQIFLARISFCSNY